MIIAYIVKKVFLFTSLNFHTFISYIYVFSQRTPFKPAHRAGLLDF